jgi:nicotinamidase-related amidase
VARPAKNRELHGNAPDSSPLAVLLVDVISDFEFDGGDRLLTHARPMARRLAALARRARALGVPVLYVNDNFGRWRSDFASLVRHCLRDRVKGRPIARLLRPARRDYFVLKPKHSAFMATPLETLLTYLGTERLVVTGLTADRCVLFTAADAHMRDFRVHVPRDCVASIDLDDHARALVHMERVLGADLTPSTALDLPRLARRRRGR